VAVSLDGEDHAPADLAHVRLGECLVGERPVRFDVDHAHFHLQVFVTTHQIQEIHDGRTDQKLRDVTGAGLIGRDHARRTSLQELAFCSGILGANDVTRSEGRQTK